MIPGSIINERAKSVRGINEPEDGDDCPLRNKANTSFVQMVVSSMAKGKTGADEREDFHILSTTRKSPRSKCNNIHSIQLSTYEKDEETV
jgi:hypothetical protein